MSSILVESLSMSDIFLKFCLLNKNFCHIFEKLKTYPKLWKIKFVQEFTNNKDRKEQVYGSPLEQERFFNLFNDHHLEEGESTFAFFKRSVEK